MLVGGMRNGGWRRVVVGLYFKVLRSTNGQWQEISIFLAIFFFVSFMLDSEFSSVLEVILGGILRHYWH